jgi:hypothetical protein
MYALDQPHRGPFGYAQGRLFDSGAHDETVSTFAQDDRVWVDYPAKKLFFLPDGLFCT